MSLAHDLESTKARPGRKWPLLLSVGEVAFELGLSRRRIYQMLATGELDRVKIGKALRVPSASLLRLAAGEVAGASAQESGEELPQGPRGEAATGARPPMRTATRRKRARGDVKASGNERRWQK